MTQDVTIEVEDGGLGILPATADDVSAVIGCSSQGDTFKILATTEIDALVEEYGDGPLVEAAAFSIQATGAPVLAVRCPSDTAGANSAVTKTGAGTSVGTLTGTPNDDFDGIVLVVKGGTIGTAGASIRVSLDGGQTYGPEVALGTATSYAIPRSGLTVNFAAGTLIAGNTYTWTSTAPAWAIGDVQDAFAALAASVREFSFAHLVGAMTAANGVTLDTGLTALANAYRFTGLLGSARDFGGADTDEADWIDAISSDFASFESKRVSVSAGHYLTTSPVSGRMYRRPLSFAAAARLAGRPVHEDLGKVRTGSLAGITYSTTDGKIYHDERTTPGLDAARFLTARTIIGRPGLFVTNSNMMAPPGSDFVWWQYRRVIDKAAKIAREVLLDYLNSDVRLNPATGLILEKDALDLESRLRSAYRDGIVAKGHASAVTAKVSRIDNIVSTKTINVTIRVVPLGYLKSIAVSLGFTNPALSLA
jgi:hypothetical protein